MRCILSSSTRRTWTSAGESEGAAAAVAAAGGVGFVDAGAVAGA